MSRDSASPTERFLSSGQGFGQNDLIVELPVTAQMIETGRCVNENRRFVGYLFESLVQVANSASRVDRGRFLPADHQVDDGTFMRGW